MKRKRAIVIAAAACALIAVAIAIAAFSGPREPEYQGRKLSEWMADPRFEVPDLSDRDPSRKAIRAMGTNAVPFVARWIGYEMPQWTRWGLTTRMLCRLPNKFQTAVYNRLVKPSRLACGAATAFEVLGPLADGASSQLERVAVSGNEDAARRAIRALSFIGPAGIRSLARALESRSEFCAASACGYLRDWARKATNADEVVPAILSYRARQRAESDIGEYVVDRWFPAGEFFGSAELHRGLTNAVSHSNRVVRLEAVRTLGQEHKMMAGDREAIELATLDADREVQVAATRILGMDGERSH